MKIITSNEQLTAILPNIAVTVQGEMTLIDKLAPFINRAEDWVSEYFIPENYLNSHLSTVNSHLSTVIAYDAFYHAIPQLDLILTANGFGIVNNSNVVPASKERIERLMMAVKNNRDAEIAQLLKGLSKQSDWLNSTHAEFFRATMFPHLINNESWEDFLNKRNVAIPMEEFFATQYLSKELMNTLRSEVQSGQFRSPLHQQISRIIQAVEVRCIKNKEPLEAMYFEHGAMADVVDTIRNHPNEFLEWHQSNTADLYNAPVFQNKKEEKGFWF